MPTLLLNLCGFVGFTSGLIVFVPQAFKIWRNRHEPVALAGVSEGGQWILFVNQCAYTGYALGNQTYWSVAPATVSIPLSVWMIYMLRTHKRGQTSGAFMESGQPR